MGSLANLRISTRMHLLVGLVLIGLVALCLTALFHYKSSLLEDRKQKTRNLVEVGIGILEHHHSMEVAGKLSQEDAKRAAFESLRGLRYSKENYYFAFDTSGLYLLNGANPLLEGQQKLDMKDANGKLLVKELIVAGRAGGGFVEYSFPRAGQQNAESKLSYTTLFSPWNVILGTGIYIRPICLRSMPPSKRLALANRGGDLRWWRTRCENWPNA